MEEAVDESSRRAALGLSCMCRNPYNFRPTRVPGYRAADVPGYERGGIYSVERIRKAREEFVPEESVAFLQNAAVAPTSAGPRDLEWIKRVAQMLAFRKARFEEYDETYVQAFGLQHTRPPQYNLEKEPEKFAPKVAPLSGPLVIAEALGSKKKKKEKGASLPRQSSASATKSAATAGAKDKYLLKRRDEHPISTIANPLPDAYPPQPTPTAPFVGTPPPEMDNIVLQKREPESIGDDDQKPKPSPPPAPPPPVATPAPAATMPIEASIPILVLDRDKPPTADSTEGIEGKSVEGNPKKKKKKRPREDVDDKGEILKVKKKKKKKKMQGLGSMASTLKKLVMGIEDAQPEEPTDRSDSNVSAVSAPQVDSSPLELPLLLDDLYALAMDPFYGVNCNATAAACQVFLKFRSLVYQKSLVLPPASDQEVCPRKPSSSLPPLKEPKEKKEKKEKAPKVKLGSLFKRSSGPSKSGRKRPLSDRHEENSAKRSKKLDLIKSLASGKKAALASQMMPQGQNDTNDASVSANLSLPAATSGPVSKPERQEPLLPLPPKKESPTNLILKFPPRSTLPSVANLKARFARFGPLVVDRCRVIWNTHSCRVQFRYKADAFEAYNYVRDNNLFGQIQVRYSVKEVEMLGSQPEPGRRLPESQPESSSQLRLGNGTGNPIAKSRPSYMGPLKSILKRPGEDGGKENQRVKFKLAGDEEQVSHLRRQVQQYGGGAAAEGRNKNNNDMDVSHKLLSLMLRCNDIVTTLKSLPGFVSYCPL